MKKLFTLLFVTVLAFVFVACKEYTIIVDANDSVIEMYEGDSKNVSVQFTEGETLSWSSSSEAVATVSDGTITAVLEGETTITVAIVGHEDKASATITVKVLPIKVSEIRVTGTASVFVGGTVQLSAEVLPANAKVKDVTWSSSDESKAIVDANGLVTAVKEGNVEISVSATDGSGVVGKLAVEVKKEAVTGIEVTGNAVMEKGSTQNLQVSVAPDAATYKDYTFESSDSSVLTVDAKGLVTAVDAGTAIVTVASVDNPEVKATLEITVKVGVTNVTITNSAAMLIGDAIDLACTVEPADATNKEVEWTSSDETILKIENGKVVALKDGTAKLVVTSKDNNEIKAELEVTVSPILVTGIAISGANQVVVNNTVKLNATISPENATNKAFTWTSSNEKIATVAEDGTVTAVAVGTVKIIATANDTSGVKAELELTVSPILVTGIAISGANQVVVNNTVKLNATISPENATNKAFTWASSNEKIATVAEDGTVTAVAVGKVTICATANDASGVKAEFELTIIDVPTTTYVLITATEETVIENLNLKFGYNLFAKVEDAVNAVFTGGTVVLFPGIYVDDVNIEKEVTLQSLTGEFVKEKDPLKASVLTGKIFVLTSNVVIKGLSFTSGARVATYKEITNFKFENNYVYDTAEASIAWKDTRYGNGATSADGIASTYPGFITLAGSWAWEKDTQILNNTFENVSDTNVYSVCTDGITIKGNTFIDCDRDAVRLDYNNNMGKIVIENNRFENVAYNGVYLRSYAAGGDIDVVVEGNYFKNVGTTNVDSTRTQTAAFATAAHQEATNAKFLFQYNIFDKCDGNINIRGNVSDSASWAEKNITFTLDVKYNAFILKAAEEMINKNFFGSDTETTNFKIGTFNNNFYGTDFVTKVEIADANYENILAKDTKVYDNIIVLNEAASEKLPTFDAGLTTNTVVEADTLADKGLVQLEGQVIYVSASGFLLKDTSGVMFVKTDKAVQLGDKIKLNGYMGTDKQKQVQYVSQLEVLGNETYTYNFTTMTVAEFVALDSSRANIGKEITLTGTLVLSGTFINFKLDSSNTSYTSYLTDDLVEQLGAYAGKEVTMSFLTHKKSGTYAHNLFPVLDTIVTAEDVTPLSYVVDPNKPSAVNRVQKLSDLEGKLVDGMNIIVKSGNIEGNLTIDKNNVTITGLGEDSVISGVITIAKDVANTTIEKLTFKGKGKISGAADGGQDGITIDNCIFDSCTEDGFVKLEGPAKNLVFTNNKAINSLAARGVRAGKTLEGFVAKNNYLEDGGGSYDWFRTDGAISGEVVIEGNVVKGSHQSFIMFMYHGSGNFTIKDNEIYDISSVAIDIHTSNGVACTSTFNIIHNLMNNSNVDPSGVWNPVRLRFNDYTEKTLKVNVNYNIYINWMDYNEANQFIEDASNCTLGWINADNNYFDGYTAEKLSDKLFDNIASSYLNPFTDVDELEKAYQAYLLTLLSSNYDFVNNFADYANDWDTSYTERVVTSEQLGDGYLNSKFTISNCCKQANTITDCPVIAAKNNTVYVTVEADFSSFSGVTFKLKKWSDKKVFTNIHIEFSTDGTTWTTCSEVVTAVGDISTNASIAEAKYVRLSITTTKTSNQQLGLTGVEFTK